MIGGVKITQIPLIKAELRNHYRKLKFIKDQRKNYFSLDSTLQESIKKSKSNHVYFSLCRTKFLTLKNNVLRQYYLETQKKLAYQNVSFFYRLESIQNRKPQFSINQQKSYNHGKNFVYRKKQQMAIQATNQSIVQRLMNKTGFIDHNKDLQQFHKTRQVLHRMQKFRITQKKMSLKKRSYTLPPKINLDIQTQEDQN